MKIHATHNLKLPTSNKRYILIVGIIDNSYLAGLAKELDQGTDKVIPIPKRVLKVVPEALEMGFLEWDGIPSRPYIERTISLYSESWKKILMSALQSSNMDLKYSLNVLGEKMLDQLKSVVADESWQQPNSMIWKLYKERTGSDVNPLMHTHKFLNALNWKVQEV